MLWLWCSPAAAALIRSLAWEPSYATGAVLGEKKKKKTVKIEKSFTSTFSILVNVIIKLKYKLLFDTAQVGTRAQSERIRTYNFTQDRVTDHRIAYEVRNIKVISLNVLHVPLIFKERTVKF